MFSRNPQKGVSLYIATIVMLILLAIALGVSTILFGQIKMIKRMGDSVQAIYAADTGIEQELRNIFYTGTPTGFGTNYSVALDLNNSGDGGSIGSCPSDLSDPDDACYKVCILSPGDDGASSGCQGASCTATLRCVRSKGFYKNTSRAIEITQSP